MTFASSGFARTPSESLSAQDGTRLVEFTTTTGTWVSVDVNPDGDLLVFDLLGDLYTLPTSGGTATPLIQGPAFDSQPRYSPAGDTIVYVSDATGSDNLWLARADGTDAHAITALPRSLILSPIWRADGGAIYATVVNPGQQAAAEIWEFPVGQGDGVRVVENVNGRPAPLVSSPAPGAYSPTPAPDGSLYYTSLTPRPYGSRSGASSAVMRFDGKAATNGRVALGSARSMKPTVAPDGSFLIYAAEARGQTGLKLRDLGSGDERWLAYPIQRNQLESRATRDVLPNYSISRDSQTVFAAFGGRIRKIDVATGSSQVVPFTADVKLEVEPRLTFPRAVDTGPVQPRRYQSVAAGPGSTVAVATTGRIFIVEEGGRPTRLTDTPRPREYMPAWSPDGKWIAYVTWDGDGGHLWRAAANGSEAPQRLSTDPAMWLDPVWAPDGESIVALRAPLTSVRTSPAGAPSDLEIVAVPTDGTPSSLGPANGLRGPHFTRSDATKIFLGGLAGLTSVEIESGHRRLEVPAPESAGRGGGFGPPRPPEWRLSPDGGRVALRHPGAPVVTYARPATGMAVAADGGSPVEGSEAAASFAWADGEIVWLEHGALARVEDGTSQRRALEIELPRATPTGTIVLRGGTAITMRGDEVIENADIIVTDNRIVAVGPAGSAPAEARVVDISGKYVVPGFIDVHAHFPTPANLYEPDGPAALANLAFGVTSLRNPQASPDVFALADMVAADGSPAPRIFSTGPGIFSFANIQSLDHARATLTRYRDEYRTHLIKSYLPGNRQQRQWIVAASRELEMMTTTEGGADTKANLTHAIDGFSGNEHALPVAPFYDDVVQLLARSGITYAPTLVVSFGAALPVFRLLANERPYENVQLTPWFDEEELFARSATRLLAFPDIAYNDLDASRSARDVLEAGGRVALGGHGEAQGLSNHWEMELLAAGGMSTHDVLRVATLHGAEALGYASDLGSLEPGKLADLVVLDRNPLVDIRATTAIQHVMKNGVLYASDLAELWPTVRPAPAPWRTRRDDATIEMRIDELVRGSMGSGKIPGAAVAIIQDGEPTLARGYGVANLENDVRVSDATMFQSGSLGKQFTTAGIMALVEDGVLDLDGSVREHLPETPETWNAITVRHLLTHASGIPDYTGERFDYTRNYSEQDLVRLASELELEFIAGTRWNYSNTGYVMLGVIMSRVTGAPYWEYLRERIFDPAGMPTIRVNTEAAIVPHRARGYRPTPDGWRHADWVAPDLNTTADGSMLLSLRDIAAWHQTVRSRSVLSANSWELILSPMTLSSGARYPYGFGWFIDSVGDHPMLHHSGSWQGFTTQYSYFPDQDLGVLVLANARSISAITLAGQIAAVIAPELRPVPPATEPIPDPHPEVSRYVAAMLAKSAAGTLELADFAFVRQTVFPRMQRALFGALDGLGAPDRLELLSTEVVGDDTTLQYWAWFGERRFRVLSSVAPAGGLTALRVLEPPE